MNEYLLGQETELFEKAQDAYLEMVQNIADIAFALLLDTGLAATGETQTIGLWRQSGDKSPEELIHDIPQEWLDVLLFPDVDLNTEDPLGYINKHNEMFQQTVEDALGALSTMDEMHETSVLMIRLALFLASSIGADSKALVELWDWDSKKSRGTGVGLRGSL